MTNLAKSVPLRQIILPIFRRVNLGDISVSHHWTGDRLRLHSFRHKGYWFYGKRREHETMLLLAGLVRPGDTVYDVGAHIGYLSLYLASLAGPEGRVYAFEPAPSNVVYLRRNADAAKFSNITVVEKAIGDRGARVPLFTEDLTGQNNSLLPHYSQWEDNARESSTSTECSVVEVDQVSLDAFSANTRLPAFIKIDVEGAELSVLHGMRALLSTARPAMMVEVSYRRQDSVALLHSIGYKVFSELLEPLSADSLPPSGVSNIFAIPSKSIAEWLRASSRK